MLQRVALAVKAVCFGPWNVYQEYSGRDTEDRLTSTPTVCSKVCYSFALGFKPVVSLCIHCAIFTLAFNPNTGEEGIPLQTQTMAQWRQTGFANRPRWLKNKHQTTCLCSAQVIYSCTIPYQSIGFGGMRNEGNERLLQHYSWYHFDIRRKSHYYHSSI